MNCSQVSPALQDYLDDELTPPERRRIDQHLTECERCRQELESWRSLEERTEALPQQLQPGRDLWPGIAERIDREAATDSYWWLRLAAAGIALAVFSVPLSVWWVGRQAIETGAPVAVEGTGEAATVQAAELARSEDGVQLARTDLITTIERQRDVVEDDTLRVLEDNMMLLDRAIGELRTALDENPQDLRLRMLLASRYQQERKLLQKASRV